MSATTRVPAPKKSAMINEGDFFGTRLSIPAELQKELEAKGLVGRFVSTKTLSDNAGRHPKGWMPYSMDKPMENTLTGNSDKIYRIGDLVLAVKSKEAHARHVKYLEDKSNRQSASAKGRINEMREHIRESKGDKYVKLTEGYEENE